MKQKRLLLLLALLLTAATGAWAQTETLLLTIENKDYTTFTSGSKTFDDKVTVTFSKTVYNEGDTYGWYAATESLLTVAGTNGYNITSCKFYTNDGTANTGYTIAGESPSVYLFGGGVYTDANQSEYLGDPGITKIEVYTAATGYTVSMKDGVKDAGKWTVKVGDGEAQALPIGGLKGDGSETVTLQYTGRLKVKGVQAVSEAAPAAGKTVDLSTLTADYEAQDGDKLTGVLGGNYKISIADGATVTLDGVTINGVNDTDYEWAGITCEGSVTIILMGANTVTGASEKAAIKIGGSGTTLTITGSGSLTAQGGLEAAGIGTDRNENGELSFGNIVINGGTVTATGGKEGAGIGTGLAQGQFNNTSITCGDITINGGTVTATGGLYGAGIGTGPTMSDGGSASITCGDITINGGTVTATGGDYGPGIGTGVFMKYGYETASNGCGAITIGAGVTSVTATKGSGSPNSIGKGYAYGGTQNYGTITIGGTVYATGVTTSPFTYTPSN